MQRAVAALARREYSRAELARTLQRHVRTDDEAAALGRVLDELQVKGLLSDARFAAMLARRRAARFGAERIRQELRAHQLADDLVQAALDGLMATEEQRARDLWRKRFGRAPVDATERARQWRFLAQRGFAADVIARVIKNAND